MRNPKPSMWFTSEYKLLPKSSRLSYLDYRYNQLQEYTNFSTKFALKDRLMIFTSQGYLITMSEENTSTGYQPRTKPFYTFPQYAAITFILSPILGYLLAYYGFIPFDPLYTALAALAFCFVYVGYRGYYWKIYRKDERQPSED